MLRSEGHHRSGPEGARGSSRPPRERRRWVTASAVYGVRAASGETPEELWLGVQQRMGELEHEVTAGLGLVDLDGGRPLDRPPAPRRERLGW